MKIAREIKNSLTEASVAPTIQQIKRWCMYETELVDAKVSELNEPIQVQIDTTNKLIHTSQLYPINHMFVNYTHC